jgi:hypothetical protein
LGDTPGEFARALAYALPTVGTPPWPVGADGQEQEVVVRIISPAEAAALLPALVRRIGEEQRFTATGRGEGWADRPDAFVGNVARGDVAIIATWTGGVLERLAFWIRETPTRARMAMDIGTRTPGPWARAMGRALQLKAFVWEVPPGGPPAAWWMRRGTVEAVERPDGRLDCRMLADQPDPIGS